MNDNENIFNADDLIQALIKEADEKGISESCLDEAVHDLCSRQASEVNNGGIKEQIKFIVTQEGPEAANCIRELFKEDE